MMYEEMKAAAGALSSLKTAYDLANAFIDVKGAVEVQSKVFELQRVILSAQQDAFKAQEEQAKLLGKIRELEEHIFNLNQWGEEKTNYQLQQISAGALVYALKPESNTGEPPHWLCVPCFTKNRKAFLQKTSKEGERHAVFQCTDCKNGITTHWSRHPAASADAKS